MKRLLTYLIVLILAILLGLVIHHNPGYVLLAYGKWTAEMPLWFALLAILIVFMILHYTFRFFVFLPQAFKRWRFKREHHLMHKAHTLTGQGILNLIEGHFSSAEKLLVKGAQESVIPVVNYLGAAVCAQQMHLYDKRDQYIAKAHAIAPDEELAVNLTQAQLQMAHQQYESALATLRYLNELEPKHGYVLKLLKDLYVKLEDWDALDELLPMLLKVKVIDKTEHLALQEKIFEYQLHLASMDPKQFEMIWRNIPRSLKKQPRFAKLYEELKF